MSSGSSVDLHQRQNTLVILLAGAAFPGILAIAWLFIPPLWNTTDSTSILLWPKHLTPHFPPLYPGLVAVFEDALGINATMLRSLLAVQQALLFAAIIYAAAGMRTPLAAAIMSTFLSTGTWFGAFSQTVTTEALAPSSSSSFSVCRSDFMGAHGLGPSC